MNMHAPTGVMAPPQPRRLEDVGLNMVMMRDILLKTMFRMNLDQCTELSKVLAIPLPIT